jgi:hypothetical protein
MAGETISHRGVQAAHWAATRRRCAVPGDYLVVEDTTLLDYSHHHAAKDLGHIGNGGGRGFLVHSSLALRLEAWDGQGRPAVTVEGLLAQRLWGRHGRTGCRTETHGQRLSRPRESQRWAAVLETLPSGAPDVTWTYVADREADILEVLERCVDRGMGYVIRAQKDRVLTEGGGSLFAAVRAAPLLGTYELNLRGRPGQEARKAMLEVRAKEVVVRPPWRPGGRHAPLTVAVVEAWEPAPPPGVPAVHWVLLTSWPHEDFAQVRRVLGIYTQRWLIEEYHKALKTGTRVEASQLESAQRLEALAGILAVVAVRLLNAKLQATARPESPLDAEELSPAELAVLEAEFTRPAGGWTYRSLLVSIARLGGFLARRGDGNPGWLTIWRGWRKLQLMAHGYNLAGGT